MDWDTLCLWLEHAGPGRSPRKQHLRTAGPHSLPPVFPGRLYPAGPTSSGRRREWVQKEKCGLEYMEAAPVGDQMWNQNQEETERLGLPLRCLGVHRETIISIFFTPVPQRGPSAPVPELHKNVSCREARDLLGPLGPLHPVCLLDLCLCPIWFCLFYLASGGGLYVTFMLWLVS
jgi:hypothetical protein